MVSQSHTAVKFYLIKDVDDKKKFRRKGAGKQELGVQLKGDMFIYSIIYKN